MPHPLPALATLVAAPLFGLAVHAATHATARPAARAVSLPNNLCASCHRGKVASIRGTGALDARDLVAARTYLADTPRG